jgi:Tfp pilus assembly protein PilN
MALHINLYHEIHREAQARRRDPLKLASYAGIGLGLLFVAFYGYTWTSTHSVVAQAAALDAQYKKLAPEAEKAKVRAAELEKLRKVNVALIDRIQNRFYWAPFLGRFQQIVPNNIQITSLSGDVDAKKRQIVIVLLNGVAAGEQPRTAAEEFRVALQQKLAPDYAETSAVFDANSLEDSPDTVQLDGKTLPTATFRIRLQFKTTPPVAATPTPTPSPKAR